MRPVTGEPERMYKVVLAGDCAVGKSKVNSIKFETSIYEERTVGTIFKYLAEDLLCKL